MTMTTMTTSDKARLIETIHAYEQREDFGRSDILSETKTAPVAYTEIYADGVDQEDLGPWGIMQVNISLTTPAIIFENADEEFARNTFDSFNTLAAYLEDIAFEDFYALWLDRARPISGYTLN